MLRKPALLTFIVLVRLAGAGEPRIDPAFPVTERNISPPTLYRPIHDCARVVHVAGFISMAVVKVFANGVEVGKGTSLVGEGDIRLTRALVLGESITATQTAGGVPSGPSDPVPVEPYPLKLTTPVVSSEIYACGRVVPVDNLVASTRVQVSDVSVAGSPVIGTGETAGRWFPVGTSALVKDHSVMAIQLTCPDQPSRAGVSPPSNTIRVKASPTPVPRPVVDQNTVIVEGSDVIVVHSLLPGAEVEIKAGSTVISSGYFATASDTWFPLAIPVPPGHPKITAIQKLCTPSLPSDPVIAVDTITPPVIGSRICPGSRFVSIDKTVLNANIVLLRRTSASPAPTPIGYAGAMLGTVPLKVNAAVTLNAGDVLTAVQYIVTSSGRVIASSPSNEVTVGCDGGANVITHHNDNFRTGAYLSENLLTPASVLARHMQQKFRIKLNGSALTQPLYVREVAFPSGGANAVFAGTMNNSVYAVDASNGAQKWRKDLVDTDSSRRPVAHGVDTTPVIDVANNRIYVLFSAGNANKTNKYLEAKNLDSAYWLVALDLRTGDELARTAVAASAFASDGSLQTFTAKYQTAHPALLLDHGSIYAAFGSEAALEGDLDYLKQYHGWVMKYRASDLALQGVFCTSPNLLARPNRFLPGYVIGGSGIWQGGGGLAADPDGNIYFLTGNGRVEFENSLYGDSFVKLTPFGSGFFPTAFMPNTPGDPDPDLLEKGDADLGSGGPLLIPGSHQAIGGGKTGWMYLLDRNTMQFQQRITAAINQYPSGHTAWDGWDTGPHLHGSPTFWQGTGRLYVWGEKDYLRAFPLNPATNRFDDTAPAALRGDIEGLELPMPGAMMSLSAQGNTSSSGILWAVRSVDNNRFPARLNGRLYAFDARNLRPLWDHEIGAVPHMAPPTIADGKVFVTNYDDELIAFELGPDGNNLNWTPYKPTLSSTKCQACHQPGEAERLQRQHPWSERFPNEASLWALPSRTLQSLAPPQRVRKILAVEGNGVQTYVATESGGTLVWTLKESTADLVELGPDGDPKQQEPVRVQLSPGSVWTASDGSRVAGEIQKTAPAPSETDAPWSLFRAISTSGAGSLTGVTHIQCVYTHAGQAPASPPQQRGQVSGVRYFAQYWFYR